MLWKSRLKRATVLASLVILACSAGAYVAATHAAGPMTEPPSSAPGPAAAASVMRPTAASTAGKAKGLHFVTGPANVEQKIADRLKALPPRLAGGDPATIQVGPVLPFWKLKASDITVGKGLESADPYYSSDRHEKNYRYTLQNGGQGFGVLNIIQVDGRQATVASVEQGTADTIVPALAKLAEMKEVKEGSYEVRYLDIVGVTTDDPFVFVLWLKCDDGGKDYIYPVANSSARGVSVWEERLYTQEEFFKVTKPVAEQAQRILSTRPFSFN